MNMLENNHSYGQGTFEEYRLHLDSIKKMLPADLFAFVSNPARHTPGPDSLLESRVISIACQNTFNGSDSRVTITLMGSRQDRHFVLEFSGVSEYTLCQQVCDSGLDLASFEIDVAKAAAWVKGSFGQGRPNLIFRALFSGIIDNDQDAYIEIMAKNINMKEKSLSADKSKKSAKAQGKKNKKR